MLERERGGGRTTRGVLACITGPPGFSGYDKRLFVSCIPMSYGLVVRQFIDRNAYPMQTDVARGFAEALNMLRGRSYCLIVIDDAETLTHAQNEELYFAAITSLSKLHGELLYT